MGSIKQSKPSRWATLQKVEWAAHDDEHDDGPHLSPQNHYGPAFMHVHRSLTQLSHPMRMGFLWQPLSQPTGLQHSIPTPYQYI
jgi:hypothetical protein